MYLKKYQYKWITIFNELINGFYESYLLGFLDDRQTDS